MSTSGAAGAAEQLRWFGLRCKPQKEQKAATWLQNMNYIAVTPTAPRMRRSTQYDKERKPIEYAVLPGCLFIGVSDRSHLFRIVNFHFISSVIGINGRYAEFDPSKLLPFLRYNPKTSPMYYKYMRTGREFDVADDVRILTGPFRDSVMKVSEIKDREAVFLVSLLGKTHQVHISVDDCEKCEQAA